MVACKGDGAEHSKNVTLGSCAAYRLGGLRYTVLSAILRCLVSNFSSMKNLRRCWGSFHPLYRGTWIPTRLERAYDIAKPGFNPLYRGTWIPTPPSHHLHSCLDTCFHPLYRGTWIPTPADISPQKVAAWSFQSAISRYLVSNIYLRQSIKR